MLLKDVALVFFGVFLTEIGDKTQLGTLSIAMQTRDIYKTIGLSMCGLILATIVSVFIGYVFSIFIIEKYIVLASGIIFLILGLVTLFVRKSEDIPEQPTAILTIFLLELGDKTQISIVTFTMLIGNPVVVFISSIVAFLAVVIITATLGTKIAERIPREKIQYVSAVFFILIGIIILALLLLEQI